MECLYNSKEEYFKNPFGAVALGTTVIFKAGVDRRFLIDELYLRLRCEGGFNFDIKGSWIELKLGYDMYSFDFTSSQIGLYSYFFEAHFQDDGWDSSKNYQLSIYDQAYQTPDWLKKGLMYQVFPDRFSRSSSYNPPPLLKDYMYRKDWGGLPNYKQNAQGFIQNNDFFGGNILGIIENLPYLMSIGVTVIYLNPIVEAFSNHRYDTGDFKKVDPLLGTLDDFKDLCSKSDQHDIRIILDGVFNHTGSDSLYFNKAGTYAGLGAYQSKDSPYFNWYHFSEFPDKYDAWWGISTLPQVNEQEDSYIDYILRNENSVVKFWMRAGASGFRLDVADELPSEFIKELRKTVKTMNPNAGIIGEVWENASNKISYGERRKYFLGEELDSVMNYPVKEALIRFVSQGKKAEELALIVEELWEDYPWPAFNSLMNSLGTHDTARILTVLGNPEGLAQYNRDEKATLNLSGEQLELAKIRLFNLLIIWAFLPGIPCIYYGDEIGMQGAEDPFNRGCFDQNQTDFDILNYYKKVLSFRGSVNDINLFDYRPELAKNSLFVFSRHNGGKSIYVAVNSGDSPETFKFKSNIALPQELLFINGEVTFSPDGFSQVGARSGFVVCL